METLPMLDPDPLHSGKWLSFMSEALEINMSMFILSGALKSLYHIPGCGKDAD